MTSRPERVQPRLRGAFGEPYLYAVETALDAGRAPRVGDTRTAPSRSRSTRRRAAAARAAAGRTSPRRRSSSPSCSSRRSGAALPELSLVAGVAVAVALEREAAVPTLVKWPNDVLVDGDEGRGDPARGVREPGRLRDRDQRRPGATRRCRARPARRRRRSGSRPGGASTAASCSPPCWTSSSAATRPGSSAGSPRSRPELERRNALDGAVVRVDGRRGTAGAISGDGRLTVELDDGETLLVESGEVETQAPG